MMYRKLFLLLLCFFLLGLFVNTIARKKSEDKTISLNKAIHPLVFFDKGTFYSGVKKSEEGSKSFKNHIAGGIIPHHLFPGFIIADFFKRLSKQNPRTVILIGPNHFERGKYKVLSSFYSWETPFGVILPNDKIVQELMRNNLIKIDEHVLPNDHAVAGIMPFVKYYLPDAQVVPILLSGFMSQVEVQALANTLKKYMNKNTILIAAVDFSHYLTSEQAQEKDKVTLETIKNFDYRQLLLFSNDYLDSPTSIATLLMAMQALGATEMELLYHTNSGEIEKDSSIETTSYFSIAYH